MKINIDGYTGNHNGIDYRWIKRGNYALLSFSFDGYNIEKKIGNVTAKPLEEDMIKMISVMEINHSLFRFENEKYMSDYIAGMKA